MNFQNKTFIDMQKDCISFLNKYQSIWAKYAVINQKVNDLRAKTVLLDDYSFQLSQNDVEGHIINKNSSIGELGKDSYRLSRQLSVFAKDTHNMILLNEIDFSETAFKKDTEENILKKCSLVLQRGYDYLNQTAEYEINSAQLDAIAYKISTVKTLPSEIHIKNNDNKILLQNIKSTISDARIILDKLDDAFEGMIVDDTFINGWFSVRKIKGRHHPTKPNSDKQTTENPTTDTTTTESK